MTDIATLNAVQTPQAIYEATKASLTHGRVEFDYIRAKAPNDGRRVTEDGPIIATLVTLYSHQQANKWGLMLRFWVPQTGGGTRLVGYGMDHP